jgi:hypothetical protein
MHWQQQERGQDDDRENSTLPVRITCAWGICP